MFVFGQVDFVPVVCLLVVRPVCGFQYFTMWISIFTVMNAGISINVNVHPIQLRGHRLYRFVIRVTTDSVIALDNLGKDNDLFLCRQIFQLSPGHGDHLIGIQKSG